VRTHTHIYTHTYTYGGGREKSGWEGETNWRGVRDGDSSNSSRARANLSNKTQYFRDRRDEPDRGERGCDSSDSWRARASFHRFSSNSVRIPFPLPHPPPQTPYQPQAGLIGIYIYISEVGGLKRRSPPHREIGFGSVVRASEAACAREATFLP
jgi:hypothetical protein